MGFKTLFREKTRHAITYFLFDECASQTAQRASNSTKPPLRSLLFFKTNETYFNLCLSQVLQVLSVLHNFLSISLY